jgi:YfiH family protein
MSFEEYLPIKKNRRINNSQDNIEQYPEIIENGVWRPSIFERFGHILRVGMSTKELEAIMNTTGSNIQITPEIKTYHEGLSDIDRIVKILNTASGVLKTIAPGVNPRQIEKTSLEAHSNKIAVVDKKYLRQDKRKRLYNKFDGMVTNLSNTPLICAVADCAVIIGYDPKNQAILLLHAGWRNILHQIADKGIETMTKVYGSQAEDLVFAISPHAGKKEFELGQKKYNLFQEKKIKKSPIYTQEVLNELFTENEKNPGHYFFDIATAIQISLLKKGVKKENIQASTYSTMSEEGNRYFYSRRKGRKDKDENKRGSSVCLAVLIKNT